MIFDRISYWIMPRIIIVVEFLVGRISDFLFLDLLKVLTAGVLFLVLVVLVVMEGNYCVLVLLSPKSLTLAMF